MANDSTRNREKSYFDRELRRLRDEGRRFARRYPGQARSLGLDGIGDVDPMVQRLEEAFAFLVGKVRERLDDDYPELAGALLTSLWPHYLRPFPATTIVEFSPRLRLWPGARCITAGVEVDARDPEGRAPWRFQTRYPVWVQPLRISGSAPVGSRRLVHGVRLRVAILPGASKKDLDLGRLRFYLHGTRADSVTAREYLLHHVKRVRLLVDAGPGEEPRVIRAAGPDAFRPVGLDLAECLVPQPARSFPGYAMLQEYFVAPEKFYFVDLAGLAGVDPEGLPDEFQVEVEFDRPYPENAELSHETLRLHCAPAVNLFEHRAVPIIRDPKNVSHPVRADIDPSKGLGVFAILRVSGSSIAPGGGKITYRELAERRPNQDGEFFPGEFFQVEQRVDPATGLARQYLSFADPLGHIRDEVVHADVLCFNQVFPAEVPVRWIEGASGNVPDGLEVSNLTQPTRPAGSPADGGWGVEWANLGRPRSPRPTPTRGEVHWRLVSHLAVSQASLADPGVLAEMLRLYDWSGDEEAEARVDAIGPTALRTRHFLRAGSLVNGFVYDLSIDESKFTNLSDVRLFGDVLSVFLSQYAALNSAVGLEIRCTGSRQKFEWAPRAGAVAPL